MYGKSKIIWYAVLLAAGAALFAAGCFEAIEAYWAGIGGGLAGVSAVRLFLAAKYHREPEYARKVDTANRDERNVFISGKARSWTFLITVLALCVLCIVLRPLGYSPYANLCGYLVGGMLVIYWVSYLVLSRKY